MKAWSNNEKKHASNYVDIKIYPSKHGWLLLKRKKLKINNITMDWQKKQFEEDFEHYSDKSDGSFLMSIEMLCREFSEFLTDKSLVTKNARIIKSRMHKYLSYKNITLQQFKNEIAGMVWNESN